MTQDEIIRMAREAGLVDSRNWLNAHADCYQIERFAALAFAAGAAHEAEKWKAENKRDYQNCKMAAEKAAAHEREACAKVCEEYANAAFYQFEERGDRFDDGESNGAAGCAAAIRARGE